MLLLITDLTRSNVVTVGIGAAPSSIFQLTVVDLHTHSAITCPAFNTHARHVTWTHIYTVCLHIERERERETQLQLYLSWRKFGLHKPITTQFTCI